MTDTKKITALLEAATNARNVLRQNLDLFEGEESTDERESYDEAASVADSLHNALQLFEKEDAEVAAIQSQGDDTKRILIDRGHEVLYVSLTSEGLIIDTLPVEGEDIVEIGAWTFGEMEGRRRNG